MQGCSSTLLVVISSNLSLWLLCPCYVSLKRSLWTTSKKPGQSPYSFALSPFSLSKKTKSPSNKGKMNQTVGWETLRWESTQPMRVRREGGKVRVNSKHQLQTVWHLGECERESIWKDGITEGDSSGHDEFDVSGSALLQSLWCFYLAVKWTTPINLDRRPTPTTLFSPSLQVPTTSGESRGSHSMEPQS